jgi:putative copper resistance protein D
MQPITVTALLLFARVLYLAAGMVLVNATIFRWLILTPASLVAGAVPSALRRSAGRLRIHVRNRPILGEPGPPLPAASGEEFHTKRFHQRLRTAFLTAAAILAGATILWFWAVTAEMAGTTLIGALDRASWSPVLFETRFGLVCQVRLGLLALLGALAGSFFHADRLPPRSAAAIKVITSLNAAALLASVSWTGHAGAATGAVFPWLLIADSVHLLAGTIWPTGLLFFAWILSSGLIPDQPAPLPLIAAITQRFALVSLAAVVMIALTGSIEAWIIVRSVRALVTTSYGQVLCLKLATFAAMLGFAVWNRFQLLPRLHHVEDETATARATVALRQLRRFVRIEVTLAAGIISIVALLGTLAPPH